MQIVKTNKLWVVAVIMFLLGTEGVIRLQPHAHLCGAGSPGAGYGT